MQKALAAPGVKQHQSGQGSGAGRPRCEVFACAACMALVGVLLKESETGIIGFRSKETIALWKLIKSMK